ncbi:MAG TPA: HTTM domain-containing protein [Polyangia bacterium]|nr:HTTM domain-containing protein [Polyangia bacterium]
MSRVAKHKSGTRAAAPPGSPGTGAAFEPMAWLRRWLDAPQPIERLVLLRVLVPLAVLGFLSSRLVHADHWLGSAGFRVPDLGGDWRQPLYLPAMPPWAAWTVAVVIALSGLSLVAGFATPVAAAVLALLVGYATLADRLEAFTVTKLAPPLTLALLLAPCGARYSVDAWLRRRRRPAAPLPTTGGSGTIRFFQVFLVTMYSATGIAKARGDWLTHQVLWTHLHDQYQTAAAWLIMRATPAWGWWILQGLVLLFEVGAPLWFALPWTRRPALVIGLGMHAMIGLMFGPVVWFALLMASMLVACFLPEEPLRRLFAAAMTLGRRRADRTVD